MPRLSLTPPRKSLLTSRSKSQMVSSMLRSFSSSQVTFSKTNVWFHDGLQLRLMTGLLCEDERDRSGSRQLHARHTVETKTESRFKHSHYFRWQHCRYCRYSTCEVQVSAIDLSLSAARGAGTTLTSRDFELTALEFCRSLKVQLFYLGPQRLVTSAFKAPL